MVYKKYLKQLKEFLFIENCMCMCACMCMYYIGCVSMENEKILGTQILNFNINLFFIVVKNTKFEMCLAIVKWTVLLS